MSKCKICGTPQGDDLFSYVTQKPVCSICTIRFGANERNVQQIREKLGLKPGEFIEQDRGKEASKILGR